MTGPAPLVVDASALASLLLPDETPVALEPGDMAGARSRRHSSGPRSATS